MNQSTPHQSLSQTSAFTLIELLVVVAMLGLLSLCLAPALCRSKNQTKVAACAANFRQWAVSANMYAKDNRDLLPSFNWPGGDGEYVWEVSTNMVTKVAPYGLTIPTWYCPVRPNELTTDQYIFQSKWGRAMATIDDLQLVLNNNSYNVCIIHHNYWVPRSYTPSGAPFPTDWSVAGIFPVWAKGTPSLLYGWPKRLDDRAAAHVPFVSDECGSGSGNGLSAPPAGVGFTTTNISPNTAHFFGGRLGGVNAAYVDGHVEMHGPTTIKCGYGQGNSAGVYWFY